MRSSGFGPGQLRRGLRCALVAGSGVLAVACSSAAPQTFHPSADSGSASSAASSPSSAPAASLTLVRPPFGHNARVLMTSWMPSSAREKAAVMTAKDFVLAVLYADYTGGRDHRWRAYVSSPRVRIGLTQTLHAPSVTTESFKGTVRFWRMHAVPGSKGAVVVTECVDTSHARNTSLSTGKVLPPRQQTPHDQNYYSNSDVLARDSSGRWGVISIPSTVYYPQAQECKP
jgi:hypothetical protein